MPQPRCTKIEALYNLGNEENKSTTLNIGIVKFRDPPADPPPNIDPVAATPDSALAAAAVVPTTTVAPSSPASPAAFVMERRCDVRSRSPRMTKTYRTGVSLPVSLGSTVSDVSPVSRRDLYSSSTDE